MRFSSALLDCPDSPLSPRYLRASATSSTSSEVGESPSGARCTKLQQQLTENAAKIQRLLEQNTLPPITNDPTSSLPSLDNYRESPASASLFLERTHSVVQNNIYRLPRRQVQIFSRDLVILSITKI